MNQFLSSRFVESVRRLALGIEPADPVIRSRIGQRIEVSVDRAPFPLQRIERRNSCRHTLLFTRELVDPIGLRLEDPTERYVPRRLLVAMPNPMLGGRVIRPALFPGAAYGPPAGAMGMRGRITRGGEPLRWARVEAHRAVDDLRVGCAHGDEHGEFLLLLDPGASRGADLILPLEVRVTVFGPDTVPDPDDFPGAAGDPLWDLPVEPVTLMPAGEAVLGGRELPAGYASRPNSTREVEFGWHGLVREEFDFS